MANRPENWDKWNKDKQWGYLRGLAAGRVEPPILSDRLKKYITIQQLNPGIIGKRWKTRHFAIILNKNYERIGLIKWYGGWRKYVAYLDEGFFDSEFLKYVGDFCFHETLKQLGKL